MSWFGRKSGDPRPLPLSERLYRRFFLKYHGRYLITELQLRARQQSVDYIVAEMGDASLFEDRWALLRFAAGEAPAEGLMLECGVADGASLRHLAGSMNARQFHGFDSFEGLPEAWSGTFEQKGKFGRGGTLPEVPSNVALHKGWFDQTLPAFLAAHADPIAFLHVDCDIYSSTVTVLQNPGAAFQNRHRSRIRRIFQLSQLAASRMARPPGIHPRYRSRLSLSRLRAKERSCRGALVRKERMPASREAERRLEQWGLSEPKA